MQENQNSKLIGLIFFGAFILVTGGIIFLNSIFMNIFKFNFTPVSSRKINPSQQIKENYSQYLDSLSRQLRAEMMDSLKLYTSKMQDSISVSIDSTKMDSLKMMRAVLQKTAKEDSVAKVVKEFAEKMKNDSTYNKWTRKTALLYEAMEPKKAAKIIQNYSDNIARDILYSMKKKKAAEILANLTPDLANRFTRIR